MQPRIKHLLAQVAATQEVARAAVDRARKIALLIAHFPEVWKQKTGLK